VAQAVLESNQISAHYIQQKECHSPRGFDGGGVTCQQIGTVVVLKTNFSKKKKSFFSMPQGQGRGKSNI
jgi:hypothetical protein